MKQLCRSLVTPLLFNVALAALLSTVPRSAAAQGNSQASGVRGQVVDAAGAPIAHAQIVARAESGAERGASVDPSGRYVIGALPPGSYTIQARALGFEPALQRVSLTEGTTTLTVDFRLTEVATSLTRQVVTATRSPVSMAAVPGAVTVVTQQQIEEQTKTNPQLGPLLAQLVPGLGAATENLSNYGQNIRGRDLLLLIDGVPQSTSRNVSRDFINIDPAMIERVEVVRGATSIYGNGATGGVINIITKSGTPGDVRFSTSISTQASLSKLGDGLGPRVTQQLSGSTGPVDFMASGAFGHTGALFDAEGDRIPPDPTGQGGFAETDSYDLFGKMGYSFGVHRLQLSANWLHTKQSTDFASDYSINALPPYDQKARALPGLELDKGQGTDNTMLNLEYSADAPFGNRLRAQAFYRDYETVFRPFDRRSYQVVTDTLGDGTMTTTREFVDGQVMQTYVKSEKGGGRLDIETPLSSRFDASVLWGADYTDETTSQPAYVFDSLAFDQSDGRVFRRTGDAMFVPPLDLRTLGLFAQLSATPVKRLVLRAGIRHERASISLDDFSAINGVSVEGGEMRFTPTLFNAGAVVTITDAINVFGGYSEGFSLADVGRVIREPAAGFTLGSREAEPQRVKQFEGGVRGSWRAIQTSLTAFRNTSELGTSLGANLTVVRAPERVYGLELTLDAQPTRTLNVGGTATWTEGDYFTKVGSDSVWQPLNSFRIQPLKLTAYAEHQTLPGWTNRVQLLHSGSRGRAYDAVVGNPGVDPVNPPFGNRPVNSYTVVDLLSTVSTGPGQLSVGIRNLFNEEYFPIVSQLMPVGNVSYSAAPGATLTLGYTVAY
ncbi:MAG TPA: TonB-dependent receptor [Gemmatimonadaceae bacterium]|nr:TonB-dependent receptor [Gemmatimonadaceae bacterium]